MKNALKSDKKNYYLFDPEEDEPVEKARNTRLFKHLETNKDVNCIFTWQMGIRGITYWKQCYPVAWFDVKTKNDYEQFMGRSNREVPAITTQKGALIVKDAAKIQQDTFEAGLL